MDPDDLIKFNEFAAKVREAREEDQRTLAIWKEANRILTERQAVFDSFVASCKAKAINTDLS